MLVCVGNRASAQPKEKYEGKTLIVCKWGENPGECQTRMWEGDGDWPRSFVVDDKEHVYLLDHLNNRVHHYDESGKFVGEIPIQSYKLSTEKEKKENTGLEYATVSVKSIWQFDGKIYAAQKIVRGNIREENILKLQGDAFVKIVAGDEKTRTIKRKNRSRTEIFGEAKDHLKGDPKFKISTRTVPADGGPRVLEYQFYDGLEAARISFDQKDNRWVLTQSFIRKYSPTGEILAEIPCDPQSTPVVSKQGNLYLLDLYSTKPGDPAHLGFEDYWEGVGIKKFTLVK
jgi:hypothetical protein